MSRRGWILFLAMAVVWGIPYLLIRVAVRQLDPGVLVFARTAPVAVLLLPVVVARGHAAVMLRNLKWIAAFAVIEFGIPWYLMATAERHITSSLTSLLICCVPLFAVIAHRLAGRHEPISRPRYVGLGVGALGVLMLVGLDLSGGSVVWIALMLLVCTGYTIGPMILANRLDHVPGIAIVAGATGVVAFAWTPWAIVHWPHHVSGETLSSTLILSLVCTAAAFLIFFELVKEVGSTRSVVVTYVNTGIAVMLGVVGLHEPITMGVVVGFPLVLIGSIYATSSATPAAADYAENSAAT